MAAAAVAPGESTHASHTPFLRLSVLLGDMTDRNLTLAAQAGATDVVAPYTKTRAEMVAMRDRIAKHGMRLAVCERLWPHDAIVHNLPGRDAQIEDTVIARIDADLYRAVGSRYNVAGYPTLVYFPKGDRDRWEVYTGERMAQKMVKFMYD